MARREAEVDLQRRAGRRKKGSSAERPVKPARSSTPQVFGKALVEECRRDERVIGITAAMTRHRTEPPPGGIALSATTTWGSPSSRQVLLAAGLALQRRQASRAIYSTFLQRAYDQIVHDVCLQKLNVVFAMDRAGLVGDDGPTHHGDVRYRLPALPAETSC